MSQKNSKKFQHKITPEVEKQIQTAAKTLPPCQIYQHGKPMARRISKRCTWDELQKSSQDGLLKNSKKLDMTKMFTEFWEEPVMVNHVVCLRAEFQMHGQQGIEFYVEHINKIMAPVLENEDSSINT